MLLACGSGPLDAAISRPPPPSNVTTASDVTTSIVTTTAVVGTERPAESGGANGAEPPSDAGPSDAGARPGTPSTASADDPNSAYCQRARAYKARQGRVLRPVGSAEDLRQFFTETQRQIDAAVAVAPARIRAEVKTVAGAVSIFVAALEKANYDLARVPPDARSALAAPSFKVASTRIAHDARQVCGVR